MAIRGLAVVFVSALCSLEAVAEPVVSPLDDDVGGVRTYHALEKFQVFNAPSGTTHAGGVMRWHYRDANRPASISKANAIARIQSSMNKWSSVCRITFSYQGETSTGFSLPSSQFDGINIVGWDATGLSAPTTGVTSVAWNGSNTVIDVEIRFNAAYAVTVSSFDATATHEIGHALGLDHSDVSGQVMSGPPLTSYNGSSSLSSDDVAGCVRLYGSAGGAPLPPQDTQAPSVPTGLVATGTSTTSINLTWGASSDNVGVANYRVFQGGASLGTVTAAGASVSSLSPASTYTFTVSACDAAGNCSAHSAAASGTTQAPASAPPPPPPPSPAATPGNWQDMWWSPGENGWGLTITQHRDVLFLAWYVYDSSGRPIWVVMSSGQWDASRTVYSGEVHIPSGSWYGGYSGGAFNVGAAAGTASVTFTGSSTGVLSYNVRGAIGSKPIARLPFGPVNTAPIASYADMWWGGATENGWGLVISQQYHNLFATWFTYDAGGQTTWFVMSDGVWTSTGVYTGTLYRTRGTQVIGSAYNPAAFGVTPVGSLTLSFTGANSGTMTYTVDGLTQSKSISRLGF